MRTSEGTSKPFCAAVLLAFAGIAACDGSADVTGAGTASNETGADAGPTATSGSGGTAVDATGGQTGGAGASGDIGGAAASGGSGGTGGAATGGTGATATGGSANGAGGTANGAGGAAGSGGTSSSGPIKHVFVITMENESAAAIYGSASAPYINGLLPAAARANAFADPLPDAIPSEPHYVWMEAGTNHFSDATFTTDADPSAKNSTASTAHLSSQMDAASPRVSWLSYQEGLNASTGACPVRSSGFYAAKHDPYVFFQDVAGNPPSPSSGPCAARHRAYTAAGLAQDLQRGTVAQYNFISPNVCHDMHGGTGCPGSDDIRSGDDWLAAALPPLIAYANANDGVIFIVWDEPVGGSTLIPFVAIGPQVKPGYASSVRFTHSSLTKTVEEIFGLPLLPAVASANDLSDLFLPGTF
jgi:phosphatidylinositol-3-phosphatase